MLDFFFFSFFLGGGYEEQEKGYEEQERAQGHMTNKWQSQHLSLDCLTLEQLLFTTPSTAFQEELCRFHGLVM